MTDLKEWHFFMGFDHEHIISSHFERLLSGGLESNPETQLLLVKDLLNAKVSITDTSAPGYAALQYAVQKNIAFLKGYFAYRSHNSSAISNCSSIMRYAICNSHFGILALLFKAGADANEIDAQGRPVLHEVCAQGNNKLAELLLECGADIDRLNSRGQSVLHWACFYGRSKTVLMLIGRGVRVNNCLTKTTALHVACNNNMIEIVEALVEAGSDIHTYNEQGELPLHIACAKGCTEVALILIRAGAIDEVNKKGKTAIEDFGRLKRFYSEPVVSMEPFQLRVRQEYRKQDNWRRRTAYATFLATLKTLSTLALGAVSINGASAACWLAHLLRMDKVFVDMRHTKELIGSFL